MTTTLTLPSCACLCPACRSHDLQAHGQISDYPGYAGDTGAFSRGLAQLLECNICGLAFRNPQIPASELINAYENCDVNIWAGDFTQRPDWLAAQRLIERDLRLKGSILDVGCFTGSFLSLLPDFHKFGIEPGLKPAKLATKRGVQIIGSSYYSLKNHSIRFDWITAFDVIEHVNDPADFIQTCLNSLTPMGRLIISSGNFHHSTFQFMMNRYYYCSYPEHISFISPPFIHYWSKMFKANIISESFFSHSPIDHVRCVVDFLKNMVFCISPRFFNVLRKSGISKGNLTKNASTATPPPTWTHARDHYLVVLSQSL
jgi:2-polyprenyl-3-methyl-5-hydroxy-6-metoxy-1,4-benzoquinol methylase